MNKKDLGKKMSNEELMELTGGKRFRKRDCKKTIPVDVQPLYGIEPMPEYGIPVEPPMMKYGIVPVLKYGIQPLYGIDIEK